jgi:hypothetical protein
VISLDESGEQAGAHGKGGQQQDEDGVTDRLVEHDDVLLMDAMAEWVARTAFL